MATAGPREKEVPGLNGNHRGMSTLPGLSSPELATPLAALISGAQKEGVAQSAAQRVIQGPAPSVGVSENVEEAGVRPSVKGNLKLKTVSQRL